jgi:hypothetical protein
MADSSSSSDNLAKRVPWNKGKVVGATPPLRPSTSGRSGPSFRSKAGFGI